MQHEIGQWDRAVLHVADIAADLYKADAEARDLCCRRMMVRRIYGASDIASIWDRCNGADICDAVQTLTEEAIRLARYIATGEEAAQ
jgi:hypothetical protein